MSVKQVKSRSFVLQNCFRQVPEVLAVDPVKQDDKYVALETSTDFFKGYQEQVVEYDYPITSESVTSYASGVDYKRDLFSAMKSNSGQNLGDVREAQRVANNVDMNTFAGTVKSQIEELKKILDKIQGKSEAKSEVKPEVKPEVVGGNE